MVKLHVFMCACVCGSFIIIIIISIIMCDFFIIKRYLF